MSLSLISFLSVFIILANYDAKIENAYMRFINEINILNLVESSKIKLNKDISEKNEITITGKNKEGKKATWTEGIWKKNYKGINILANSGYNRVYRTAFTIWKEQPIFGFGLKSFRLKCWEMGPQNRNLEAEKIAAESDLSIFSCSTHPHHYYLELLCETGLIGTILMVIFFLILLKEAFCYLKKYNKKIVLEKLFLIPIIIVIFLEIWPLRSSGSFFTTTNATFFWLSAAILLTNKKQKLL